MDIRTNDPESVRPFRLYDTKNQRNVRWRYYKTLSKADDAALLESRWLHIGVSIEVYDCRNMKVHSIYTRKVSSVQIEKEDKALVKERQHGEDK